MGLWVHGESLHVVLRIAAATQEDERMATIQEGCTEVVLGGTVSIAVAPVVGIATRQGIGHPQGTVGADGIGLARCSI